MDTDKKLEMLEKKVVLLQVSNIFSTFLIIGCLAFMLNFLNEEHAITRDFLHNKIAITSMRETDLISKIDRENKEELRSALQTAQDKQKRDDPFMSAISLLIDILIK